MNYPRKNFKQAISDLNDSDVDKLRNRFLSKRVISPDKECWGWIGNKNKNGYGLIWLEGRNELAHRVAWFLQYGEIPEGMIIHSCGNLSCVNPKHLVIGDAKKKYEIYKKIGKEGIAGKKIGGVNHPKSKLSAQDIFDIKDLYDNSELTTKEIGELWGITQQHASRIGRTKKLNLDQGNE